MVMALACMFDQNNDGDGDGRDDSCAYDGDGGCDGDNDVYVGDGYGADGNGIDDCDGDGDDGDGGDVAHACMHIVYYTHAEARLCIVKCPESREPRAISFIVIGLLVLLLEDV